MDLFVGDLNVSVAFYIEVLGFAAVRRCADDYVGMRRGQVVIGFGPVAKLPEWGEGPGLHSD
jgi:catechol 2,3-dioxygenase-like lactoylglutathione lyase family enzyme